MPQKLNLKTSKNISFTKTLAKTNKICTFQQDITVYLPCTQLPTSTSPPSRTAPSSNTSRPRFPSPLQRSLWPPEDVPDSRRIGGSPDARGPADLLALSGPCDRAPPPGAECFVARWVLCCDPQLVKRNVLLVQCGTLILQTPKPANLRIWSA